MPRKNRRVGQPPLARPTGGAERRAEWRGDEYVVRALAGSDKQYRCPGCDQLVRAGVPHVVVWPAHDTEASDRRHWHTACWWARDRRSPMRW